MATSDFTREDLIAAAEGCLDEANESTLFPRKSAYASMANAYATLALLKTQAT